MSPTEDPGWTPVFQAFWRSLIPGMSLTRRGRDRAAKNMLSTLRGIWCSLVAALFLIWFALGFIRLDGPVRARWFPYFLAAYAVFILAVAMRRRRRAIRNDLKGLSDRYRAVFFIVVGLSQSIATIAFPGTFIMNTIWIYPFGLALSLVGMWWIAPTARHLRRDQERLRPEGTTLSLVDALVKTPPNASPSS